MKVTKAEVLTIGGDLPTAASLSGSYTVPVWGPWYCELNHGS